MEVVGVVVRTMLAAEVVMALLVWMVIGIIHLTTRSD
jgi:hypothetical protein